MVQWSRFWARVGGYARAPATKEYAGRVLLPFAVQRTLLVLAAAFGSQFSWPHRTWHALPNFPLLDGWVRFDSQYYLLIAAEGYGTSGRGSPASFFPLYGWLTRGVAWLLPLPVAALLVANLAAVGTFALLYRLAKHEADEVLATRVVWVALLFPTSFFFSAAYSESTYVFFGVGAVLAWRLRQHWVAVLCAAAAVMARPVGIFCFTVPFVVGWLIRSGRLRSFPWLVLGAALGAGLILLTYLVETGDALAFWHAGKVRNLRIFWQEETPPWWDVLQDEGYGRNLMRRLLNWGAVALVAAVSLRLLWRREVELGLLCLVAIGVPLYFHHGLLDAASMARYSLAAFPMFLVLARWTRAGMRARGLDLGFQMLQVLLAAFFTAEVWAE